MSQSVFHLAQFVLRLAQVVFHLKQIVFHLAQFVFHLAHTHLVASLFVFHSVQFCENRCECSGNGPGFDC